LHSTKYSPTFVMSMIQNAILNQHIHKKTDLNHFRPKLEWLQAEKLIKRMNIENTQSQMRKGILEFCILSIIRRGEAYPSDIVEEMRAANLQILEGTLYPLLTRLKNADMLTYRWVESNSGPPRKYFSLTEKGLQFYRELEATWNELANAVNTLATKNEQLASIPNTSNNI
jgi:PadR family transcriptional regulator, regulatory protein PadR